MSAEITEDFPQGRPLTVNEQALNELNRMLDSAEFKELWNCGAARGDDRFCSVCGRRGTTLCFGCSTRGAWRP